jgi:hypothetical protein
MSDDLKLARVGDLIGRLSDLRRMWVERAVAEGKVRAGFSDLDDWQRRRAAAASICFVVDFLDGVPEWQNAELAFALREIVLALGDADARQPPEWLISHEPGRPTRTEILSLRGEVVAVVEYVREAGRHEAQRATDIVRHLLGDRVMTWLISRKGAGSSAGSPRAIDRWRDAALSAEAGRFGQSPEQAGCESMQRVIAWKLAKEWNYYGDPLVSIEAKARRILDGTFARVAEAGGPQRK